MKKYVSPSIQINEDYAEGIFMASGDNADVNLWCPKGNIYFSRNSEACKKCTGYFIKKCPEGRKEQNYN